MEVGGLEFLPIQSDLFASFHHLVEAFRYSRRGKICGYYYPLVDSVNPDAYKQMHIVYETLANLSQG